MLKSLVFLALAAASTVFASVLPTTSHHHLLAARDGVHSDRSIHLDSPSLVSTGRRLSTKSAMTNAQRFARGLPPSKPTRLFDPSRRQTGGSPSGSPTATGLIVVAGSVDGYVSKTLEEFGLFTVTSDITQALQVSVPLGVSSSNILLLNANSPYPDLGLIVGDGSSDNNLYSDSANYAYVGAANPTLPDTASVADSNSFTYEPEPAQTPDWFVDPVTFAISVSYVNTDGTHITPSFVYQSSVGYLVVTGNVGAFNGGWNPGVTTGAVTFTFQPNPV